MSKHKDMKIDDNYSMDDDNKKSGKVKNVSKKLEKIDLSEESEYSLSESEQIANIKPIRKEKEKGKQAEKEKIVKYNSSNKTKSKSKLKNRSDDDDEEETNNQFEEEEETKVAKDNEYTPPYNPNDIRSNFIAGYLIKKKSSEWSSLLGSFNKRYFVFNGKTLKYYETEAEAKRDFQLALKNKKSDIISPLGGLALKNFVAINIIKNEPGLFFDLTTTKSTVRLQAYTEEDRTNWVNTIQRAIDNKPEELKNMTKPNKYYITGYLQKFKSDEFAMLLGNWNERYFIFDGKYLSYAANSKGGLGYTRIALRDIESCEPETANDNTFVVVSLKKDYRLRAPSAIDRDNWVKAIGGALHDTIINEAKIKKDIKKTTHEYVKNLLKESNMDETALGNETDAEETLESDDENTKAANRNNIHKERAANYVDQLRVEAGISKMEVTKKKMKEESEEEEEEEEEETPKVTKKVNKAAKKVVESDSDEAEEDTPKVSKKKVTKATKKKESSSEEEESEEETPVAKSVHKNKK